MARELSRPYPLSRIDPSLADFKWFHGSDPNLRVKASYRLLVITSTEARRTIDFEPSIAKAPAWLRTTREPGSRKGTLDRADGLVGLHLFDQRPIVRRTLDRSPFVRRFVLL